MKLVTSSQMRELDRRAISRHKIPSLKLMEKAGEAVANAAMKFAAKRKGPVVIIAGRGNNGGDGLVCARHLIERGHDVIVILLAQSTELSPDARANWEFLAPLTTHIITVTDIPELNANRPSILQASVIVDAVMGTGLANNVQGLAAAAIELVNSVTIPKLAVDVPSGLSADTGKTLGVAVRADATVTFGLPKLGLFIGDGPKYAGEVEVADIGIPKEESELVDSKFSLIDPAMFSAHFGKRDSKSHKGTYGHVAVFAGSLGHLGAGYLACMAALRAGCGLVTYCLPEKAFVRFDARYPEIMCDIIPDGGSAHFHPAGVQKALDVAKEKSVVAIGPAIGTDSKTREFLNQFVSKLQKPVVIDADGLNVIELASLKGRNFTTILTPHPGEMARLMNTTTEKIQSDRLEAATSFASTHGVHLILKGHGTIVARPDGSAAINPTGNAGMASAGMGDALTGIVASFLAQGMEPWVACAAAVYIHGIAGDMAAAEHGERALITSDVIKNLGRAMKEIEAESRKQEA